MRRQYSLYGHGEINVLVGHTWFADHSTYTPMLDYLDPDIFTYAFIDYRGYGAAAALAGDYTVQEMGQDMVTCANELQWDRFHLLGNSMGGQAVQWIANHYPARVKSLLLLSSVPAECIPQDRHFLELLEAAGKSMLVRQKLVAVMTGNRYSASFTHYMSDLSRSTASRHTIDAYLRAWMGYRGIAGPSAFSGPVKAYVGQFNPVLTLSVAEQTIKRHLPQADIEEIPGCGHFASIEVPVFTASAVESFFRSNAN